MVKFHKPGDPSSALDISEQDAITFQGGKAEDPFGGLLRSGFQQGDFPQPKSNILPDVDSTVSSSNQLREDEAVNKVDAGNLVGGAGGLDDLLNKDLTTVFEDPAVDESLVSDLDLAREDIKRIQAGDFSSVEQEGISLAEREAATPFDEIIREAEETRRQSLARAEIEGGKKTGGVFSSQIQGQGGQIARIKSIFDRNISNLQVRRANAISKAKAAARKALETGASTDLQFAKDTIGEARKATKDAQDLALERIQAINSIKTSQRNQVSATFDAIKDQLDISSELNEGETAIVQDPFTGEDITIRGMGQPDPFFTSASIVSLMKELQEGETKTVTDPVTGTTYNIQGFAGKKANQKTITSTNDRGDTTVTTIDTSLSGPEAVISQSILEGVGKTKSAPVSITIGQQQGGLIGDAAVALKATVGDDGFINTATFKEERIKFVEAGGSGAKFDDAFKRDLNPDDPEAKRFLTSSDIKVIEGSQDGFDNAFAEAAQRILAEE